MSSVHVANCGTLVLDAGQIAIESKLADKDALQEVYDKRHSVYTDEDFDKLEALMYDIFTVKLKDAQVRFSRFLYINRGADAKMHHGYSSCLDQVWRHVVAH